MNWIIGGSGKIKGAEDNIDSPRVYSENNINCFEILGTQNLKFSDSSVTAILENSSKYNVKLGLHGKYNAQIVSLPDQDYDKLDRGLGTSIYYVGEFNCPLVIHPGGNVWGDYRDQTLLMIQRLDHFLKLYEVGPDLVYLETTGKIDEFGYFPELVIANYAINTRICVDWAHIWARSMAKFGNFSKYQVRFILNTLEKMSWKYEQYFHISGIHYNSGGESKHCPLENSEIPWKMILEEIRNSDLAGRIILESSQESLNDIFLVQDFLNS